MTVIFGSARHDENGRINGGVPGDQTGTEVSTQNFYVHSKGWYVLRAKNDVLAKNLAKSMQIACDNPNIGYAQDTRYQVVKKGIDTKERVNADCSSLVRACLSYCGYEVGDFYTGNAVSVLEKTGLFKPHFSYTNGMTLYDGDILCTKVKGHIGIIVKGATRGTTEAVKPSDGYSYTDFVKECQKACGCVVDGIVGPETRTKVCGNTISTNYNKYHKVVTPLERWMKKLGYYNGEIEADLGKTPIFGSGMAEAIKKYQRYVVKATENNIDGIISRNGATWRNLIK